MGLNPTDGAETKSRTLFNQLSHPGAPSLANISNNRGNVISAITQYYTLDVRL